MPPKTAKPRKPGGGKPRGGKPEQRQQTRPKQDRAQPQHAKPQLAMQPRKRPAPTGDDDAFPRGGGDGLTALERRQVQQQAEQEFEAELKSGAAAPEEGGRKAAKGPAAKRQKQDKGAKKGDGDDGGDAEGGEDAEGSFFNKEAMGGKVAKYVELLKAKNVTVGMRVWGVLLEVSARGLMVSLPHGLRGHVQPAEASDLFAAKESSKKKAAEVDADTEPAPQPDLTRLFHVGQYVRCVVVGLPGGEDRDASAPKKSIQLSLRLKRLCKGLSAAALQQGAVVPASVRSAEDHGYTLDLGIKGVTAFLKRRDHEAVFGEGSALLPGTLLEVAVISGAAGKGARAVQVSTDPALVSSAVLRESDGTSLDSLLPGSVVPVKVRKVLEDGLLVSFLTFFHGTIDPFHLSNLLAGADWKRTYSEGHKLKARILYVDPATKQAGLSLLPHLLSLTLPSPTPMLAQLFQDAKIKRVHPGLGLLLELKLEAKEEDTGAEDASCAGFVHISNVWETRKDTPLDKAFRVGQAVKARVIGFRLIDGLATLSMKESVVDQESVSYAALHPGMALTATVASVEDYGLLVTVGPSIKGLVPLLHASDMGTAKALTKFKAGQKITGRVLEVSPNTRRLSLTLKPALLSSRLQPLASLQQAAPGLRAHGVVTGVKDYGIFVSFYGGMGGLAHVSTLALAEGAEVADSFKLGQVVKAVVLAVEAGTGRLKLGLAGKKGAAAASTATAAAPAAANAAGVGAGSVDPFGGLQPGDVVEEVVVKMVFGAGAAGTAGTTAAGEKQQQQQQQHQQGSSGAADAGFERVVYLVELLGPAVAAEGEAAEPSRAVLAEARLEGAHLSDHPAGAEALRTVLKKGSRLGPVVVLERLEVGRTRLRVSRKASLVSAAASLPTTFAAVKEGALLPGYVASVTGDAVFVRFLSHVTGRAGLSQLADTLVSDPKRRYAEGQSVRAQVVQVDAPRQRFSITLKPSLTTLGASDASYLRSLFSDLEAAEKLRLEQEREAPSQQEGGVGSVDWSGQLAIGALVEGNVDSCAEYALLLNLDANEDLVGVLQPHQQGAVPKEVGARVSARVLDVSKREGIVDLSAKPAHIEAAKAGAAAAATGGVAAVTATGAKGKAARKAAAAAAAAAAASAAAAGAADKKAAGTADLRVGDKVAAVVELVKSLAQGGGYVVMSLPASGHALAFASTTDYNQQDPEHVAWRPQVGQTITTAVVASLPSAETGGQAAAAGTAALGTQVGRKLNCRVHITEVQDLDEAALPTANPLAGFRIQQPLEAVVIGKVKSGSSSSSRPAPYHQQLVDLSLRPP